MRMCLWRIPAVMRMLAAVAVATGVLSGAGCSSVVPSLHSDEPLRVGMAADTPPISYQEGEDILGIEVDCANLVAARLGRPLQIERLPFGSLIEKLRAGEIDVIMSGMACTEARAQSVAFTDPYLRMTLKCLARTADAAAYHSDLDLKKAKVKVAAQPGTIAADFMRFYFFGATSKTFIDPIQAPDMLLRGEIDLYLHDSPVIEWLASANEGQLAPVEELLMRQELAWAVRLHDRPLHYALNRMLRDWRKDGTLDRVFARWIPDPLAPPPPATDIPGLDKSVLLLRIQGEGALTGRTASINVDGELSRDWALQDRVWLAISLPPGEHLIRAAAEGCTPVEQTVGLPIGSGARVTMTLRPAPPATP